MPCGVLLSSHVDVYMTRRACHLQISRLLSYLDVQAACRLGDKTGTLEGSCAMQRARGRGTSAHPHFQLESAIFRGSSEDLGLLKGG